MDTSPSTSLRHHGAHPLLILAALAVVLFCLVGTAAILGWLPSSIGANPNRAAPAEPERLAPAPAAPPPALAAQPMPAPPAPAPQRQAARAAPAEAGSNWCANCGNIESVRTLTHRAPASGVGAAGGAVLGGLLGNQIGSGHGRQLATVAGAVGGAVVGNQVEGNMKATRSYEIRVRLDDGTLRTFHQDTPPDWRSGERVKIVQGRLRRP